MGRRRLDSQHNGAGLRGGISEPLQIEDNGGLPRGLKIYGSGGNETCNRERGVNCRHRRWATDFFDGAREILPGLRPSCAKL